MFWYWGYLLDRLHMELLLFWGRQASKQTEDNFREHSPYEGNKVVDKTAPHKEVREGPSML
jgi:hypothetical protein